jgi:16S rRNA (adenine1518-N6/adenine1519-N6)-dimethyltransferase
LKKSALVAYFKGIGFQPSQRLGQNFLIDANLARLLVDHCEVSPTDHVVEIGPGMGMITREILGRGARLSCVEADDRLVKYLESDLRPEWVDQFEILHGDAVRHPLANVDEPESVKVICNPPFAITGPWLAGVLNLGFPKRLSLLLQQESVDRLTAESGKLFGVLPIRLGASYEVVGTHPVPPSCFYPEPTIDCSIVTFSRKAETETFPPPFLKVLQTLFTQRRKQIGGRLRKLIPSELYDQWSAHLATEGLNMQCRPEQIPTKIWLKLSQSKGVQSLDL